MGLCIHARYVSWIQACKECYGIIRGNYKVGWQHGGGYALKTVVFLFTTAPNLHGVCLSNRKPVKPNYGCTVLSSCALFEQDFDRGLWGKRCACLE